ncbi:hypothetical protein RFI_34017, partial [Reticulomyxa filosa]
MPRLLEIIATVLLILPPCLSDSIISSYVGDPYFSNLLRPHYTQKSQTYISEIYWSYSEIFQTIQKRSYFLCKQQQQQKIELNELEQHIKDKTVKTTISYASEIPCMDMKDLDPNEWVVGSDIYTDTYKTFVNTTCSVFEGSYIRGIELYTNYLRTFWCFDSNYSTSTNYTISSFRQSDRCYGLTGLAFPVDGYLFGLKMEWNYVCNDNQKKAMDASQILKLTKSNQNKLTPSFFFFFKKKKKKHNVGDILDTALAIQYACTSDEGSILQLFSKYFADGCAALSSALSVGSLLGLDVTNESKKKKIEVGLITHCYESNIHYDSYPTTDAFQEFIQINGASAN